MMPGPGFPGEALKAAMGINPTMLKTTSEPVKADPGVLASDACKTFRFRFYSCYKGAL